MPGTRKCVFLQASIDSFPVPKRLLQRFCEREDLLSSVSLWKVFKRDVTFFYAHSCCQTALIRVMSAALSYSHFWLPGLIHNFLFKVLEGF